MNPLDLGLDENDGLKFTSVDAFERANPALAGAMRRAVREELEAAQANGTLSGDMHFPLDLGKVAPDAHLVFRDSVDGIGQCDKRTARVTPGCGELRILGGIDRLAVLHMVTSLLVAGAAIVALMAAFNNEGGAIA